MPPIRSGKRVVFLTLDDSTGPVDATFFEDAQGPFAHDLFNSWILLVRGEIRRTGPRGFHCAQRGVGSWGVFVDCGLTAGLQRSTSWYLLIKFPIVTHRINELL